MLSVNGTFLLVLVSFVVFMLLMRAVFFEPVRKVKAEREEKLKGDADSAHNAVSEISELNLNYESALKDARAKAQALVASLQTQARQEAQATVQKARSKAQEDLDKRMGELHQWREDTYQTLSGERQSLTRMIIDKVSGGVNSEVSGVAAGEKR